MRLFKFLLAGALFTATSASAQMNSPSLFMPSPAMSVAAANTALAPEPATLSLSSEPAPAPKPQQPIGIHAAYNFQAYVGYTYMRFWEAPGFIESRNGFNSSLSYYFHDNIFAAEGSFLGAFGSQAGYRSRFLFAGGGPRVRWSAPRGLELWAHGLFGGSHYLPQTAYGTQGAFGYEIGGGVDITAHRQRFAYRFEANMIGTKYFNTYQFSPMGAAGVVFKF